MCSDFLWRKKQKSTPNICVICNSSYIFKCVRCFYYISYRASLPSLLLHQPLSSSDFESDMESNLSNDKEVTTIKSGENSTKLDLGTRKLSNWWAKYKSKKPHKKSSSIHYSVNETISEDYFKGNKFPLGLMSNQIQPSDSKNILENANAHETNNEQEDKNMKMKNIKEVNTILTPKSVEYLNTSTVSTHYYSTSSECQDSVGKCIKPHYTSKPQKNFLKKFISKKSIKTVLKPDGSKEESTQTLDFISDEECIRSYSLETNNSKHACEEIYAEQNHPTKDFKTSLIDNNDRYPKDSLLSSYMSFPHLDFDVTLTNGLREIYEFQAKIRESESHLVQILTKYLNNEALEKELVETLNSHTKLHIEAERQAHKLSNEMWLQQSELNQTQERALQDSLSALVKQNRQLLGENENLMRKNEKLILKCELVGLKQYSGGTNLVLEGLSKANDSLRSRYNNAMVKVDHLEKELVQFQNKHILLIDQQRNSHSQIENYKGMLDRAILDFELERTSLHNKLKASQNLIKDTSEAGDVLIEDLNSIKNHVKNISINWDRVKDPNTSVSDLIHFCRSCINDLIRELVLCQNDVALKQRDIERDNIALARAGDKVLSLEKQNNDLLQQISSMKALNEKAEKLEQNKKEVMIQLQMKTKQIEEYKTLLEKEKSLNYACREEMAKLNEKLCEKEARLLDNESKMNDYLNEIEGLNVKLTGLNEVLASSGTGELSKQFNIAQDKLIKIQTQQIQILAQKSNAEAEIERLDCEKQALLDYQKTYYEHLQILQNDIDVLNKANISLKEQLEMEHATVTALQAERMRHLEEKHLLTAIYQQLKSDVDRVEQLESYVQDMNSETSRLTVIAEFNKQIGVQLQNEVLQRDVTITELQKNIEKLNGIQQEQNKDREALSLELNEICSIKEELNKKLLQEMKKCEIVSKLKDELDSSTEEIHHLKDMQKEERAALKQLLSDFEFVSNQRDELEQINEEQIEEMKSLQSAISNHSDRCKCLEGENEKLKDSIMSLQMLSHEKDMHATELQNQFKMQHELKDSKINVLNNTIDNVEKERNNMQNTIDYLKNNLHKVTNDLNMARQALMESRVALNEEYQQKESLSTQLITERESLVKTCHEKSQYQEQLVKLRADYDKLISEHDILINEMKKLEEDSQRELTETKELLKESSNEISRLIEGLNTCKQNLETIRFEKVRIEMENADLLNQTLQLDGLKKKLEEYELDKQTIEMKILAMKQQASQSEGKIVELINENNLLKQKVDSAHDELVSNTTFYKNCVGDMEKEYYEHRETMKKDLQNLTSKIFHLTSELADRDKNYYKLEKTHKEVADKLLNSVRMCIDEKCARQTSDNNINSLNQKISKLITELSGIQEKNSILTREQEELVQRIKELNEDKNKLQVSLSRLQEEYNSVVQASTNYEKEIEQLQKKCKNLNKSLLDKSNKFQDSKLFKEMQSTLKEDQEKIELLTENLNDCHETITALQNSLAESRNQYAVLEFQKCEAVLRLHETMGKLSTEQNLNSQIRDTNQKALSTILQMKESGNLSRKCYDILLSAIISINKEMDPEE